ncbi:MAG: PINc/VapC family ATPase [Candidatus Aenigmatarchaeota archaeon]
MIKTKIVVPDTSILVKGLISQLIKDGKLEGKKIVIPNAALDELQAQASRGKQIGFDGLEEIKNIRKLGEKKNVILEFSGTRPTLEEIQLARKGRIDAIIRDVANKLKGTLITGDYVQALVGEAEGVDIEYIAREKPKGKIKLESFFTSETQSVHLKTGVNPLAKRGRPGNVKLVEVRKKNITEVELEKIIEEIVMKTRADENSFIEMSKNGAMVIQMGITRISITRPPFSEALELTAVRPIAKVKLEDYKLHKELEDALLKESGILISGAPAAGKSSFAAAVANFLAGHGKIVKTFEQPRDLQVRKDITQYAPLENDWEKTAELLLLVRPDYTIFDEIRKTKDFRVFGDMRLAGVGMIGVIHATDPVSAIQRFIGRLELGVIPHVIKIVIFIEAGKIKKIYEVSLTVRVPTGMKEQDLARPVVEIRDFTTKHLEYEIYTYGEENIVLPVKEEEESPLRALAKDRIYQELRKWDRNIDVEFLSDTRIVVKVPNNVIPQLIGKGGKTIDEIEKRLNISISVEPRESTLKSEVPWNFIESGAFIVIKVKNSLRGKTVDLYNGEKFVLSAAVGKKGTIKIKKKSDVGRDIMSGIATNNLKMVL